MTPAMLILASISTALLATFATVICAKVLFSIFNWIKCRIKKKREKYVDACTTVIYKDVDYDDHDEDKQDKLVCKKKDGDIHFSFRPHGSRPESDEISDSGSISPLPCEVEDSVKRNHL
jgi:hypothetical protein